jgi:Fur family transcriptional regulator, peroxide stress response regulator
MIPKKLPPPSRADAGPPSDALRARGLRLTRPRRVILEVVRATDAHPSASLVYESVRRRLPRVSLGTVYRNLRRLAAEGLVRERAEPTGLRFDGNLAPHDHFTCVACGRVLDVPRRRPTPAPAAPVPGLEILSHRVEFYGRCGACRRRNPSQEASSWPGSRSRTRRASTT